MNTNTNEIVNTTIDKTKRIVDQLSREQIEQQINSLLNDLQNAKNAKNKNRCKSIRRALRTRDYYLSRVHTTNVNNAIASNVDATSNVEQTTTKRKSRKSK